MSDATEVANDKKSVLGFVDKILKIVYEILIIRASDIALIVVLCMASVAYAIAMPIMMWHEGAELLALALNEEGLLPSNVATEFTIRLLSLADEVLLAGVIMLVIRGSLQVYIDASVKSVQTGKPWASVSAFKNLSGGTLKEKVISTIGIASALLLFKMMLNFAPQGGIMTWMAIAMLAIFHLLILFGHWGLAWFNGKHDAVSHSAPQPPHGDSGHAVEHNDAAPAASHPDHNGQPVVA